MINKFWVLAFALMIALGSCVKEDIQEKSPDQLPSLKSTVISEGYDMVPNELLVKFKDGVDEAAKSGVLEKMGGKHKRKILTRAMEKGGDNQGIAVVSLSAGNVDDAIAKIMNLPEVEYAEPNYIYTIQQSIANDFFYNYQWGMYGTTTSPSNQYGSQAAVAWASGHTGSSKVYVGIIDEGYMYMHEDLAANAGTNTGEIAGNGIDDDANGYVDDVYGWDFDANDNTVFDGIQDDHGTHVAGIIGAVGGNGIGVAGVCWNVKLLNAKFVGLTSATTENAIKAVDYFTALKLKGVNIVATNNSWSGGGYSQGLKDAIERANQVDILFIAASGNSGINTQPRTNYPSGYLNDNIISVTSINSMGELSAFSNYSPTKVDLGAPGEYIASTVPALDTITGVVSSGYAIYNGTSMAAPFVTGAAALYASTHPGAKAAEIKAAILNSATKIHALEGEVQNAWHFKP